MSAVRRSQTGATEPNWPATAPVIERRRKRLLHRVGCHFRQRWGKSAQDHAQACAAMVRRARLLLVTSE